VLKPNFPKRFRQKAAVQQLTHDAPISLDIPEATWQSLLCSLVGAINDHGLQAAQVSPPHSSLLKLSCLVLLVLLHPVFNATACHAAGRVKTWQGRTPLSGVLGGVVTCVCVGGGGGGGST